MGIFEAACCRARLVSSVPPAFSPHGFLLPLVFAPHSGVAPIGLEAMFTRVGASLPTDVGDVDGGARDGAESDSDAH